MLYAFLSFILLSLSGGHVSSVNDVRQDIENIYRVLTIPMDTTIINEDE